MPMLRTYNVFISHSWAYGDAYEKLCNFFNESPNFSYNNYSVPKNDPIHNADNQDELYNAIKRQITPCHIVVILAGVYATYSKWINKEVNIATKEFTNKKPIIAIQPWGAERTSVTVKSAADEIVKWNSVSIVSAIRRLAL